ncbi:hypothetical protein GCM10010250_21350 [Streptomyces althioticus]|uniref:hypothetical protein n=1 Tax=Streptomyces althioticus TaxID=83380 RepID=UPI0018764B36|nr:hypothetical protein GCM10010250_21350 [Streptomyces althioticus]
MNLVLLLLDIGIAVDTALDAAHWWGPPLAVVAAAAAARSNAVRTRVRTAVRALPAPRTVLPTKRPLTGPDSRPDASGHDSEGGT